MYVRRYLIRALDGTVEIASTLEWHQNGARSLKPRQNQRTRRRTSHCSLVCRDFYPINCPSYQQKLPTNGPVKRGWATFDNLTGNETRTIATSIQARAAATAGDEREETAYLGPVAGTCVLQAATG